MAKKKYTEEYFKKELVDKYKSTFDTDANKIIHELEISTIKDIISKHNIQGMYLDVACGFGRITSTIFPFFKETYAIDASPIMIEKARKSCNAKFIQMDAEKLEFDSNKFDLITAIRFIMSFDSTMRIKILKEIKRILKPEGVFICSVHLNKWSPRGILSQLRNRFQNLGQPCMSYAEIKNELEIAGFDILDLYGIKIIPFYGKKLLFKKESLLKIERFLERIFPLKYFADGYIIACEKQITK